MCSKHNKSQLPKLIADQKMKNKCMLRVVDYDIASPYKIIPDIFDFVIKLEAFDFCITLLTPHGGHHGAFCVTSYGTPLSVTPLIIYEGNTTKL